jgi:hypothetical protein
MRRHDKLAFEPSLQRPPGGVIRQPLTAMADCRFPELFQARCVRAGTRADRPGYTVLRVQTGASPSRADASSSAGHPAHRDAACELLGRSIRSADVVSELADGTFACLMVGSPGSERLSVLSWRLLDALCHLPRPEAAASPAGRPCIGICIGPADGLTYRALDARANSAMRRARLQLSGFAFFDERLDG